MKLKSLILGSVAAAGLSTAGFAADLGVLTSLDVCDDLGLSGLTISSDTNCLQISGKVSYEFYWGNYDGKQAIATTYFGTREIDVPSAVAGSNNDWGSKVESWLKFVGTAPSDFGPASATIVLRQRDYYEATNGAGVAADPVADKPAGAHGDWHALRAEEAWVSVGDTTVLAAGKKGSIFNNGDDEPFNFTGLFISDAVDKGVADGGDVAPGIGAVGAVDVATGGHVIQLWSNIGEGLIAKIGLEALEKTDNTAGTLVGVLDYAGSGVTAHISGAIGGLLNGVNDAADTYIIHTGVTATFDQFKVRAALGAGGNSFLNSSYWNGLVSGEAKFDMFKIALSAEAAGRTVGGVAAPTQYGFGGSVGATVAEGIEINIGGRYFDDGTAAADGYQVAAQLIAALTETVKLTGEIGVYGLTPAPAAPAFSSDFYASAELGWTPGGGFSSSIGAKVQQNGAYKVTFKAAKSFE